MSLPRFYCPGAALDRDVGLPADAAHHARTVLRLRPGVEVRLFDGAGREYAAVLDSVSSREVRARVTAEVAPQPESPLRVVLALAALKGDRMEWAVQKAVELGVAELRPLVTARTDAAARPALRGARRERWARVAVSAAEQCGRAVVPRVAPAATLDAVLAEPFEGLRLMFVETPGRPGLGSLARPTAPVAVLALVGPEGGWNDAEIAGAGVAGFAPVGLGPRVLRAETAALAALAALQALWGDLA